MGCPTSRAFREVGCWTADTGVGSVLRGRRSNPHVEDFPLVYFYRTNFAQSVGAEAAPAPEFRGGHQAALHRIAMQVAQFLDTFVFGPHVEIVETFLPDVLRGVLEEAGLGRVAPSPRLRQNAARKAEFESLQHRGRSLLLRLADQQVKVLGHDHVADHHELIAAAHLLENGEKPIPTGNRAEQGLPPVTATGDEMQVSSAIIALQFPRHGKRVAGLRGCRGDGAHRPAVMKKVSTSELGNRGEKPRFSKSARSGAPHFLLSQRLATRVILTRRRWGPPASTRPIPRVPVRAVAETFTSTWMIKWSQVMGKRRFGLLRRYVANV